MANPKRGALARAFGGAEGAATNSQAITTTPTAIAGLTEGTAYLIQLRSAYPTYVQVSTSAPPDGEGAFKLQTQAMMIVRPEAGEDVYVSADQSGGRVVHSKHWEQ